MTDVVVLGAGLTGLTTAVLARTRRSGGGRRSGSCMPAFCGTCCARSRRMVAELVAPAEEALALPGLQEKIARIGGPAPRYPVDGPSRADLLAATAG
jgi:hypothetical protein